MREIKFRGWDGKEMHESGTMPNYSFWKYIEDFGNSEIMQYTGLKDKNGREIYEGDILRCNETGHAYCAPIEYIGAGFWIRDDRGGNHLPVEEYREVIGNIYENPELLK